MDPSVNIIYPPHSRQAELEPEAESSTTPFSRPFIRKRNLLKLRHIHMRRSSSINSSGSAEGHMFSDTPDPKVPATENTHNEVHSGQSAMIVIPSHEVMSRRKHIMEAKGALYFPPVAILICIVHLVCFYFREKFGIHNIEDVYVSYDYVWNDGQYWRLVVAQFFHFNTLSMLINSGALLAIGRYLEQKVTWLAMLAIVLVMGTTSHIIFLLIHPFKFCENKPHFNDFTIGFGNMIYSLRVLLGFALEPRNYERDLVFGLYPTVVSASHAPWQPALDVMIYKFVLPELCVTGQIAGVLAGFLVAGILLLCPTKGVYIANPPYYWTLVENSDQEEGTGEDDNEEEHWKILTYNDTSFLLPTPPGSVSTMALHPEPSHTNNYQPRIPSRQYGKLETRKSSSSPFVEPYENPLIKRSEYFQSLVSKALFHPLDSIKELVTHITGNNNDKQGKQRLHHEKKLRKSNPSQLSHRRSKSMLSGSSVDASLLVGKEKMSSVEGMRRRNRNNATVVG